MKKNNNPNKSNVKNAAIESQEADFEVVTKSKEDQNTDLNELFILSEKVCIALANFLKAGDNGEVIVPIVTSMNPDGKTMDVRLEEPHILKGLEMDFNKWRNKYMGIGRKTHATGTSGKRITLD